MIFYKTDEEIELIRESCLLVSATLAELAKVIKPGISTLQLDKVAEEFIRDNNAVPGFLDYEGFPNTLCTSVNSQVIHGIPSKNELQEGDIVSVDCGTIKNGFYGDSAYTFGVGEISDKAQQLLDATKHSLYLGIEQAKVDSRLGDVSFAIQNHVQKKGYSVVREMVGHGVGENLHEEPAVPNYGKRGRGLKLKRGLVIAIEPMINLGKKDIRQSNDGWTIFTADKQLSAHFEHTIAIKEDGPDVLSSFEIIEENLKK